MRTLRLVVWLPLFAVVIGGLAWSFIGDMPWLTVLAGVAGLALSFVAFRQSIRRRELPVTDLPELADNLALVIREQLMRELSLSRIHDPWPLDLAYRSSAADLADHASNIADSRAAVRLRLHGSVTRLADTFKEIPSRRLVILGDPGAGKSTAVMLLTARLLQQRAEHDPVPVILPVASWDPDVTSFREWVVGQLQARYPGLGVTAATLLFETQRVIPILDGLDELPDYLRVAAISTFTRLTDAFVVTCRTAEYVQLVEQAGVLGRAAVIELMPMSPPDIANYLAHSVPEPVASDFSAVIDLLRGPDPGPLGMALGSPLMISLLRQAYFDSSLDPSILLDRGIFSRPELIEEHLLDSFLSNLFLYSRQRFYKVGGETNVRRWLAFMAAHMQSVRGDRLFWWDLERSVSRSIFAGVGALVVAAGVGQFVAGFLDLLAGVVAGLASGFLAYLTGWLISERRSTNEGLGTPLRLTRPLAVRAATVGAVGALPLALVAAQMGSWWAGISTGAVLWVTLCANAWFVLGPRATAINPRATVRASRWFALVRWLAIGLTVGLTLGFLTGSIGMIAGYSVLAGSLGAIVTLLWLLAGSVWGRFCVVRIWLAIRGVLPWRLFDFLDSMRQIGLIRLDGEAYRFRDARLREVLARPAADPRKAVRGNG
jgi:hypothetical protein